MPPTLVNLVVVLMKVLATVAFLVIIQLGLGPAEAQQPSAPVVVVQKPGATGAMEPKDKFTLGLSSAAALISIGTFWFNYNQRRKEDRRALRRSLTDVISKLNEVNVAFGKLEIENPHSADDLILNLRRQYSDQRWFYANEAEFVYEQIPELVTDIDALMIAHAFMTVTDSERSERFFKIAVSKARNNTTRRVTLRNLAQFYFRKGDAGPYALAINGRLGGQTKTALLEFQRNAGLPQSGAFDVATLKALGIGCPETKAEAASGGVSTP